ncbi:MAG: hypothetical protein HOH33_10920, partial [Verrucomicrobia bacterium]|nr:hypothetical protein [Verrucomicrobiota bacterium]
MSALKLAKRCFNGGSSFVFEGLCYALSIAFMLGCQLQAEDRFDNTHDWAIYRGDKKGNQYSELAQIHAGNVTRLKPVWEYQTGDAGNRTSSYANPIMVDGMVYVSTPSLNAVAMDAETGKQLWFFDSSKYNPGGRRIQGRNRGVVYWEGAGGARIFVFVRILWASQLGECGSGRARIPHRRR